MVPFYRKLELTFNSKVCTSRLYRCNNRYLDYLGIPTLYSNLFYRIMGSENGTTLQIFSSSLRTKRSQLIMSWTRFYYTKSK